MSHLKLAESREIELNNYVQKLLKLPIKVNCRYLVLRFCEFGQKLRFKLSLPLF